MALMKQMLFIGKRHLKLMIIISTFLFLGTINYIYGKGGEKQEIELEEEIIEVLEEVSEPKKESKMEEEVYIDIKGEVKNPGVYKLTSGNRIYDAVRVSGGLKNTADTSIINLSKKVIDEMVIFIYSKEEVKQFKKEDEKIIYKEIDCYCPNINNNNNNYIVDKDTVFDNNNNSKNNDNSNNNIGTDDSNNNSNDSETTNNGKISLNTANLDELMSLPGIGEAKALAIINYRNENGNFTKIEDLLNVSGIGEKVFAKLKDFITV